MKIRERGRNLHREEPRRVWERGRVVDANSGGYPEDQQRAGRVKVTAEASRGGGGKREGKWQSFVRDFFSSFFFSLAFEKRAVKSGETFSRFARLTESLARQSVQVATVVTDKRTAELGTSRDEIRVLK